MVENSSLDVSACIRRLEPDCKDSITPYGLSCVFPYHQIRVDEPLFCAATNYWVPSQYIFHFNGIELCSTIEEFGTIMGEPEIDDLIFPTIGGDLPPCCKLRWASLPPQQIGGMSLANLTLGWFLSTFSIRPFLWVTGHIHTFFVPFAYVRF